MRLYLVRHGQTAWNVAGRAQGHTDIPLDPTGLDQAQRLGESFEGLKIDAIWSSDLTRSVQTAEPIAKTAGLPIEKLTDLRERGFGEWEGSNFVEVTRRMADRAEELGVTQQQVRPPGGESYADVWNRLNQVYHRIQDADGSLVIVTHGGSASLLLARLVQGSLDTSRSFRFANTGYSELHRRADGLYNLVRYNVTEHLDMKALTGSLDGTGR